MRNRQAVVAGTRICLYSNKLREDGEPEVARRKIEGHKKALLVIIIISSSIVITIVTIIGIFHYY